MTYTPGYAKKRYRERIERGVCTRCGTRAPIDGMRLCDPCLERHNEQNKAITHARRSKGFCRRHNQPAVPGLVTCQKCRDYHAMRARLRRSCKSTKSPV